MDGGGRRGATYGILGPFEVEVAGRRVRLGGVRQRSVLALLLLNAGRVVSVDRMVDELWEGDPPRAAESTLRGYVSHLRKALVDVDARPSAGPLVTRPSGYRLEVDPDRVDALRFERLLGYGRRALAEGDGEGAARALRSAQGLWRGPALADFAGHGWARAQCSRLEEQRAVAVEARVQAELALGRHAELIGELELLVAEHPLRERLHAHRMLALYRCGRQADALDAYRHAHRLLADECGIDPGTELRELESAILRQDPALTWVPSAHGGARPPSGQSAAASRAVTPAADPAGPAALPAEAAAAVGRRLAPAQLPADIPDFTGCEGALDTLDDLIGESGPAGVPISLIVGTAGLGKTALAVHWAHRIADRYPDGQLYINLCGYGPGQPMRPVEALAQFLRALGADAVPATQEEAASAYRSLLAGKRILVVLDNAGSAEQVRPLLPGSRSCLVVVTSRDRLTALVARDGARRLTLGVRSPAEAVTLLGRIIGADRVRAEPIAAAELAHDCGFLPLALRIAAANLANHPHRSIADHVAELRAGDRLTAFTIDGDEESAVRAAFDQSYATLSQDARRLFRLLGLVPGPDFTPDAAAALAGVTPRQARDTLDRLAGAHLIDQPTPGRYGFHDLLRFYAKDRAQDEDGDAERMAATGRLYDWYLRTADAAARLLYPQMLRLPRSTEPSHPQPPGFGDPAAALAWLDAEQPNLVRAVIHAADHGPPAAAWLLADALRGYFWMRRSTVDWLAAAHAGLAAAEGADDPAARAAAELSLGLAHRCLTRYGDAAEHYTRAVRLSEQAGWQRGKAAAMNNLGLVHVWAGKLTVAAEHLSATLAFNRERGREPGGQAANLDNLGLVYLRLGRLAEAEDHLGRALTLHGELEDRHGQAVTLQHLGELYHALGRFDPAALAHLTAAFALFGQIGSLDGEALVRCGFAAVHRDAGRPARALEHAEAALALVHRTGDRSTEATTRNRLGAVQTRLGRCGEAVENHNRALRLARETSSRYAEAEALIGLADAHHRLGHTDQARAFAHQGGVVAGEVGLRLLEGDARTALGDIHAGIGDLDQAAGFARAALDIHRETGHRVGEVRALAALGRALDPRAALPHWREGLALATEIGMPEADQLRVLLAGAQHG